MMRAKVLVRVDRQAALNAIRALDALNEQESGWPKNLRKRYAEARRELADAIGQWGFLNGVAELAD
jgi:hypothetical protein